MATVDLEHFRNTLISVLGHDPDDQAIIQLCGGGRKYGEAHLAEVMERKGVGGTKSQKPDRQRFFRKHRPVSERVIRAQRNHQ